MTIQPWETDPAAVAYEFMTAGGMNSPEQIDDLLSHASTEENIAAFTAEAFEVWEMHVSRDEFAAAMRDFIANRPDRAHLES